MLAQRVGVAVLCAVALAGCGENSSDTAAKPTEPKDSPTTLRLAHDRCDVDIRKANVRSVSISEEPIVKIADEDRTLLLSTQPTGSNTAWQAVSCVLNQLDISDALSTQMNNTTSLAGVQEAKENGLTYKWSFHPDNGMDLIVTMG